MRCRPAIALAVVAAMAVPAGCGSEPDPGSAGSTDDGAAWAEEVMPWIGQFGLQLRRHRGLGVVPFLAPDVVVDIRTVAGTVALFDGLDAAIAYFDAVSSGPHPLVERVSFSDSPFVDRRGLVLPVDYDRSVRPGTSPPLPGRAVLFLDIGPRGTERYQMLPDAEWWLQNDHTGRTDPADEAQALAEAWTSAWSGDDPDRIRELYAQDAVLDDEIDGVAVSGRRAIVDRWSLSAGPGWTVVTRGGSPAVYLWSPPYDDSGHGVLAQVEGAAADGCPGELAVWWEIDDDGRITRERRLRSVADARRCIDPELLPNGWWSGRTPPGPTDTSATEDLERVTHRITEGGVTVDIHNGSASLAALVGWGLSRFDVADLRLPDVRGVTFTSFTDYCEDVQGRAIRLPDEDPLTGDSVPGGWDVVLCLDDEDVYVDELASEPSARVRYVVLHELAHVWIEQNVPPATREYFLESLDLRSWSDRDVDWDRRGFEWAASFVGWGLMDTPMPLYELGEPGADVRVDGFQLLTGHRPLQPTP